MCNSKICASQAVPDLPANTAVPPLTLFVKATSLSEEAELDDDDADVAGMYRVDLNADAAAGATPAKRASMALDVFHSNVPVRVLDDFRFDVLEYDDGPQIAADPAHEDYSASYAGSVCKVR